MMLIGYARISTDTQSLDPQIDALRLAGCEKVFTDTAGGGQMARPGLETALEFARPGDILLISKLDRLGRTVKGLVELAEQLREREIELRSLAGDIDTTTPQGRMFFHLMAAFAELERELIRERTRAGLAAAAARGRKGGRRRAMTPDQVEAAKLMLSQPGASLPMVARAFKVGRSTLQRYVAGLE